MEGQLSLFGTDQSLPNPQDLQGPPSAPRPAAPVWPGDLHAGFEWPMRMPHLVFTSPDGSGFHALDLRNCQPCQEQLPGAWQLTRAAQDAGAELVAACRFCGFQDDPWRLRVYHGDRWTSAYTDHPVCMSMALRLGHCAAALRSITQGEAPEQKAQPSEWERDLTLARTYERALVVWGSGSANRAMFDAAVQAEADRLGADLAQWIPGWVPQEAALA